MKDKEKPPSSIRSAKTNPFRNASVNIIGEFSWGLYADGFKRAADLLIANVETTYDINTVIYPILALYRQYLELSLKEIIAYAQYMEDHDIRQGGHDLKNLWAASKSYIRKHYKTFPQHKLDRIEQVISWFHQVDPTSAASRYPYVKVKGTRSGRAKSFSYDADPINIDDLGNEMTEVGELLNDLTGYLSVCQDLEAEFRSEFHFQFSDF